MPFEYSNEIIILAESLNVSIPRFRKLKCIKQ